MAETVVDLGRRVKAKYPGAYDDLDDAELGRKVKAKFPGAYDDFVEAEVSGSEMPPGEIPGDTQYPGIMGGLKETGSAIAGLAGKASIPLGDLYQEYVRRISQGGLPINPLNPMDPMGQNKVLRDMILRRPETPSAVTVAAQRANDPLAEPSVIDQGANVAQRFREKLLQAGSLGLTRPGDVQGFTAPGGKDSFAENLALEAGANLAGQPYGAANALNSFKGAAVQGAAGGATMADVDEDAPLVTQALQAVRQTAEGAAFGAALHGAVKGGGKALGEVSAVFDPGTVPNGALKGAHTGEAFERVRAGKPAQDVTGNLGKNTGREVKPRQSPADVPGGIEARMAKQAARQHAQDFVAGKDAARQGRRERVAFQSQQGADPYARKIQTLHDMGAFRDHEDLFIFERWRNSADPDVRRILDLPEEDIARRIREQRLALTDGEGYAPMTGEIQNWSRPAFPEPNRPGARRPSDPRSRMLRDAQVEADDLARRQERFLQRPSNGQAYRSLSQDALNAMDRHDGTVPPHIIDRVNDEQGRRYERGLEVKRRINARKAAEELERLRNKKSKKQRLDEVIGDDPPPPGGAGGAYGTGDEFSTGIDIDDLFDEGMGYKPKPVNQPGKKFKGAATMSPDMADQPSAASVDHDPRKPATPLEEPTKAEPGNKPSGGPKLTPEQRAKLEAMAKSEDIQWIQDLADGKTATLDELIARRKLEDQAAAKKVEEIVGRQKLNAFLGIPITPTEIDAALRQGGRAIGRGLDAAADRVGRAIPGQNLAAVRPGTAKYRALSVRGKVVNVPRGVLRRAGAAIEKGTREGIPGELRRIGEVAFKQTKPAQNAESRFLGTRSQVAYDGIADRLAIEGANVPEHVQRRVQMTYERGHADRALKLLDRYPAAQAVVKEQFRMLREGQTETINILTGRGRPGDLKLAETIRRNFGKWIHRTYSEAPPTKEMIDAAKRRVFGRSAGGEGRFAYDSVNQRMVLTDHEGNAWMAMDLSNPRKPKLRPVEEIDGYQLPTTQAPAQLNRLRRGQLTGALQGEADRMFDAFVARVQAGKDYLLAPSIGNKMGTPQTSVLKRRILNDEIVRILRGQQRNLFTVNNSVVKLKLLNNTLNFLDKIGDNLKRWEKVSPDQMIKVPDYHLLGPKLEGKMAPRWVADMIAENFGWSGKGVLDEFGGDFTLVRRFNDVMRFFKYKNTVLNVGGHPTQMGQNFFNLWLAGNSPLNPKNAKGHEMARKIRLGKLKVQTPEGVDVLQALREGGVLEGASVADYQTGMKRLLDRATGGGNINTWDGLRRLATEGRIKMSDAYNFWDQHAKISTYLKARGLDGGQGIAADNWTKPRKLSHNEAIRYVNDFFINYQRPSKLISFIRRAPGLQLAVNPYISSKLLSYPIWARAIARKPANVLGLMLILNELPDMWWNVSGLMEGKGIGEVTGENERRHKMLDRDKRFPQRFEVSGPSMTDDPMSYGLEKFIPAYELTSLLKAVPGAPGNDPTESILGNSLTGLGDVLGEQFLSGPAMSSIRGKYAMRFEPETAPEMTVLQKMVELTTIPGAPGSYKFSDLYKAMTDENLNSPFEVPGTGVKIPSPLPGPSSELGTKRSVARSLASIGGVRSTSYDAAQLMQKYGRIYAENGELKAAFRRISKELAGGKIDNKQAIYMVERVVEKEKNLAKKATK